MIVDWNEVCETIGKIYDDWINAEPIDYWKDLKLDESDALKKDRNLTNHTPIKKTESDRCYTIKKQHNATPIKRKEQ